MSKTKTKRARREAKREHHKKAAKASKSAPAKKLPVGQAPKPQLKKKQQQQQQIKATPAAKPHTQASQKHPVPFDVYDNILLVGEGDFSFARSLVVEHGCANVTATSFDSEEEVLEKYPTFPAISKELTALAPPVPIHHSVDATKLSTYKNLKPDSKVSWDIIAFQFPHTGGLSTDVNRQVRHNQALLVAFFESCLENSEAQRKARREREKRRRKDTAKNTSTGTTKTMTTPTTSEFLKMGGKIIVSLFENEPYTLWNIRDLARHAGLKVLESFKFEWADYPGYAHVRTLGAIEGGGAWRGEEREARTFVFEKVPLEPDSEEERERESARKRKRRKGAESEDDD